MLFEVTQRRSSDARELPLRSFCVHTTRPFTRSRRPMPRHITLSLAALVLLIAPPPANAQRLAEPIGFVTHRSSGASVHLLAFQSAEGMPRWVKWGIVGAVAGGVLFAVA